MVDNNFPRVEVENVDKLSVSFKKGAVRISFEVLPSPEILRLIYLQTMAQPLNVIIESPQSVMDLQITEINRETGEIKD